MPVRDFLQIAGTDPRAVMLADRGPQITFEVVNGYALSSARMREFDLTIDESLDSHDLRHHMMARANALFADAGLPLTARLGGVFALDLCLEGVSKTTCITRVLHDHQALAALGLESHDIEDPTRVEIWGDRFSVASGDNVQVFL